MGENTPVQLQAAGNMNATVMDLSVIRQGGKDPAGLGGWGTLRMVRTLAVTSSPTSPSPRVACFTPVLGLWGIFFNAVPCLLSAGSAGALARCVKADIEAAARALEPAGERARIRRQREAFRSYLLKNREVTYRFNGKEYRIRLIGCSLYPQGYPAIVTRLKDFKGTNLLADIGKPYLDCITSAARQYVADIFSTLRKYEYNPDLMRLYIVGGGGCLIRHFGQYDESRVTIVDDICATAKGYEYLAFSSLRRKG